MDHKKNRLKLFEDLLQNKKRRNSRICWIRWDPNSKFGYQIEDAKEDVEWMLHEIKRLKKENEEFRNFINALRVDMEEDLHLKKSKEPPPSPESGNS